MAPVPPVGRARAIELVRAGRLPVLLGSPHACAAIVEQDGVVRIRDLVIDPDEAERARTDAFARGGAWMPEHHYALGRPTGTVHLEAASREALIEALATFEWPARW
jgi:hypothetical protein